MSVEEHKRNYEQVNCMVVTVSDTRTAETDKSGNLMVTLLEDAGHRVKTKEIIPDESSSIRNMVSAGCENDEIDVILMNGGTGIAHRDVTIETVEPMFDKEMPGFGEIFRMLSYTEDIGSAAILSRAVGGTIGNTAILATPGSSGAVRLAMNKLVIPEISHIVGELKKES
ncbi:MogA/MoaB family molybdenum cofactor biosynthesis protein [Lentibacillus cibarius]|uniref:Molybdenum cofactor biosynthesis protein B n=1 Tax=Lentibacillus cibarius TaxID=2583219 RepID=A0A549YM46_9BACI|nr:MogA/MoaB family molybdenum cofactor biosynthesis protein [Lentibacillus cibarius]TMN21175.1 MogA/MoaB family molybdenum cofactor biosynthesis protein [Lentibacillus cibarius]TRM12955.1 MogA/MoaB family molybdenum cofactor biosynthesis protein [Lentibacillus cibarius]